MSSSLLSPTFIIGTLRIGSVEGASCVNLGNNYPNGFQNYKKHNQGFGSVGGDHNQITGARTVLDDSDSMDIFNGNDPDIPDWVKQMMQDQVRASANP